MQSLAKLGMAFLHPPPPLPPSFATSMFSTLIPTYVGYENVQATGLTSYNMMALHKATLLVLSFLHLLSLNYSNKSNQFTSS
jgi:hypothetical protein